MTEAILPLALASDKALFATRDRVYGDWYVTRASHPPSALQDLNARLEALDAEITRRDAWDAYGEFVAAGGAQEDDMLRTAVRR